MSDQAAALRRLIEENREPVLTGASPCEIFAITSGKGGVGKSNITMNLAIALAQRGRRVLIMDADIGTANIDILLGLGAHPHLGDVFEGKATLCDVIETVDDNLYLIPGASGIADLAEMPYEKRTALRGDLLRIEQVFDFLFLDTSAGISHNIINFMRGADRVILVCTSEPTAVVDAYALCKVFYGAGENAVLELVANNVTDADEAREVFDKINLAVRHFLKKELKYLGHVVHDEEVALGVLNQKPVMMTSSTGCAVKDFAALAAILDHGDHWCGGRGIQQLFNNLVSE